MPSRFFFFLGWVCVRVAKVFFYCLIEKKAGGTQVDFSKNNPGRVTIPREYSTKLAGRDTPPSIHFDLVMPYVPASGRRPGGREAER